MWVVVSYHHEVWESLQFGVVLILPCLVNQTLRSWVGVRIEEQTKQV
jgi:hypothetical protein